MNPLSLASAAARIAVLAAGIAVLVAIPWGTSVWVGRVGCLAVGFRTWIVGVALVLTALQWFAFGHRSEKSAQGF